MPSKKPVLGIRREDKNAWERRAPLTPEDVGHFLASHDVEVRVQSSKKRVFSDNEYRKAGAKIVPTMEGCSTVFGVKEIPVEQLQPETTYVFFSHTIKGQKENMPLLRRMLDLKSRLIDYECITGDRGKRLIFFGKYAGIAGMVDSLWALGKRFKADGHSTPFSSIKQATEYGSVEEALREITEVGTHIYREGLPGAFSPLLCVFSGRGNVSRGAQSVYDALPVETLSFEDLVEGKVPNSRYKVYKAELGIRDMFEPAEPGKEFSYREFHDHPERYRSTLPRYLDSVTMFINGIFWEARYPRLMTVDLLKKFWAEEESPRLKMIGDITCDVGGSVECNVRATDSGNPVYVFEPLTGTTVDGVKGEGPVVMSVDNLPCEFPRESSAEFSGLLLPFVSEIVQGGKEVSEPIGRAVIASEGRLSPGFSYLQKHVDSA